MFLFMLNFLASLLLSLAVTAIFNTIANSSYSLFALTISGFNLLWLFVITMVALLVIFALLSSIYQRKINDKYHL